MAGDKKISELNDAATLDGTEYLVVNQGGTTFKKILSGFLAYISSYFTGSTNIVATGTVTTGTWNAKFKPRSIKVATATTVTPNSDITDIYSLTALATAVAFGTPSGSPVDGQGLDVRIHDNGSSQNVTFTALGYRFSTDLPSPGATTPGKTIYFRFKYNDIVSKWDCISILDNF